LFLSRVRACAYFSNKPRITPPALRFPPFEYLHQGKKISA
jgi:hypothetical protein